MESRQQELDRILTNLNTIMQALADEQQQLGRLVDSGDTAERVVRAELETGDFDCVLFSAGLRDDAHLLLFEKLMNLVHAKAPGAKICFNSNPWTTAEAVQRWV